MTARLPIRPIFHSPIICQVLRSVIFKRPRAHRGFPGSTSLLMLQIPKALSWHVAYLTLAGSSGDIADAGGTPQFNMIPTNFPVVGVNNIDLQIAFQFTTGTPTASSASVTLYFE